MQAFAGPGTTGATTHPDIFETSFFVQDEWDLRPNVKVSLGLRYDRQKFEQPQVRNPDPQLAAAGIDTSFLNTDNDNLAPRLGAAWRLRQAAGREMVLRGGWGIFFDLGNTAVMENLANSFPFTPRVTLVNVPRALA